MAKGVQPQVCAHSLRPLLASVEELLASALREVVDGLLGVAILEMSIHPAEGEFLLLCLTCLAEHSVRKAAIVAMVVQYADAVLGSEVFEDALCIDDFAQGEVACHEIDKLETRKMINEDRRVPVAGLGERALCLGVKTRLS